MEALIHNAKRKKRKTRKCLDELRKRSRNNSTKSDLLPKRPCRNIDPINSFKENKMSNNNYITSKRLTLTMFAKAVRSETITRPLLLDGKQSQVSVSSIKSPVTSPFRMVVESKSDYDSAKASSEQGSLVRQSDCENSNAFNQDSNSSDSIVWCSPRRQRESNRFRDLKNEDNISTVTTNSRSTDDFGYHMYEELLEDISLYARRNLSNFVNNDIMKKTKTHLRNLRRQNVIENRENIQVDVVPSIQQTSFFKSDRSYTAPKETIVQNPMDYIKIGWRQDYESTPSEGVSPSHSPPLYSPRAQTHMPSVISFTPDYNFYPHRLNE